MNLFKKITCGHRWKIHSTDTRSITINGNLMWDGRPYIKEMKQDVLICEICGKIKILQY